jgi:stage III sporulation protein SpoIIIAA
MLPEGHRLHVVLEGISRGFSAVNIRKFVLKAARLTDLVELGSLTPTAAAFLEASFRAGLNVLVAGGTQAGKTTLLNCLAAAIPGGERETVEPIRAGAIDARSGRSSRLAFDPPLPHGRAGIDVAGGVDRVDAELVLADLELLVLLRRRAGRPLLLVQLALER